MAFDNTITVVGNVTRDPEIRNTSGGNAMTTFSVAWNNRYRKGNEQVEESNFFRVVCFGSLAENISESITKGMRVVVYGRLNQRRWETETGEQREMMEITADEVSPSLRWAKARVEKNEFSSGGGYSGGGGSGSGGGSYSGGGGSGGGSYSGGGGSGGSSSGGDAPSGGGGSFSAEEDPF